MSMVLFILAVCILVFGAVKAVMGLHLVTAAICVGASVLLIIIGKSYDCITNIEKNIQLIASELSEIKEHNRKVVKSTGSDEEQ